MIPAGWKTANSPEPIPGPVDWEVKDHRRKFYAASSRWEPRRLRRLEHSGAWPVRVLTGEQISADVHRCLALFGSRSPADARLTTAEIARYLCLLRKGTCGEKQPGGREPSLARLGWPRLERGAPPGEASPDRVSEPEAYWPGTRRTQ